MLRAPQLFYNYPWFFLYHEPLLTSILFQVKNKQLLEEEHNKRFCRMAISTHETPYFSHGASFFLIPFEPVLATHQSHPDEK